MMHDREKSDPSIVARKPANNDGRPSAEPVERRGGAEGKARQPSTLRTPSRDGVTAGLERVRTAARLRKKEGFTALLHHVSIDLLRQAYSWLKRDAAAGVDGVTWDDYGTDLDRRLADLHARVHRGSYRAQPSQRRYIPKPDGRQRPLGIAALEDKIVQRAVVEVLNAIYEEDFLGFSYGFRPKRSQHDALDALAVGIDKCAVSWILDADIAGFFDTISHEWLLRLVEHRIGDRRVVRLIRKWLKAGVMEDGQVAATEAGTPQGAVVSPLLANIYLHYVFDLWAERWRRREASGDMIIVRYADDIVVGFQHQADAQRFWAALAQRLATFALTLHPDKTRLIEFGRLAAANRAGRTAGRAGLVAAAGCGGLPRLPRRADQQRRPVRVPGDRAVALVAGAPPPGSTGQDLMGRNQPAGRPLASDPPHPSSLAESALRRQTPEVGAGCGNAARPVLCGGRAVMRVPTAIPEFPVLHGSRHAERLRRPRTGIQHDQVIRDRAAA